MAPSHEIDGIPVQNMPGRSGGVRNRAAAALPGYAVVHLHGGLTHATSDGWAENLTAPGQWALDTYPNDQRAALLWYHDHVMGVTRYSVYGGLAGLWIVRDDRERELGLPEGPPYEVPLLIQDRNFDADADGRLTGDLLHKTDPEVVEAFAPITTVNGKVWPVLDVEPTTYRFRVLNGSNARTFRLVLARDDRVDHARIVQIGSEGGLFRSSAALPAQGLILASAERADLLVDFSDLAPGSELTLLNTARAPFDGTGADPATAGTADPDGLLPYPEVMRLRVVDGQGRDAKSPRIGIGAKLATDFDRLTRASLAGVTMRAIALVELESDTGDEPPMLTMRELAEDPGDGPDLITVVDTDAVGAESMRRYRTVATRFEDTVTFFPTLGVPEIWRLINLTSDTHPIHVHLDAFQVLDRRAATVVIPQGGITAALTRATVTIGAAPEDGISHALDDNELGLKDTVRVNPNEVVDIAVRFESFAGRFMYHCHILEHEDRDMMRPFVTMPAELMPFM
ncbi:MAG TPA: multicopper oxidase domain-containing protein [Candidatus Dormibacteraeota bacterium]|nr:multicopper oxidase domain-containing protein [Candidatus Dormibacteraeota bacterium]